jgi:hypothetical protein
MEDSPFHLGTLVEGIVEKDPQTGRFVIKTFDETGKANVFDPQVALASVEGKEVRFTLASFENLQKLAEMVEKAGAGQVHGVFPQDIKNILD